ncbi:MAG: MaoC family dehydratase, partial [Candidatus Eremiobacteraeota bacterium]|nr:MaoC family dehydratase [Candidatus Eremiobacteraeota bacterium]
MQYSQSIDDFARTTNDEQWIHMDPDRARRESPFGTPVAHGFLTLSLLTPLLASCVTFPFARLVVNYGFDRVRFIAPVPAGSRVFGRFALSTVSRTPGGARLAWNAEVVLANGTTAVASTWLMLVESTTVAGTA